MKNYSIRDKCKINTNKDSDVFVGIKCENNDISIHFPLGFPISPDDNVLRKDILLLISTIGATTAKKESKVLDTGKEYNHTAFPIQAYMSVIHDFYDRGYYKENEIVHTVSKRGKINWSRTIKTQKACVQDGNVFYLDFVVKRNYINDNELITLIHEYCVYESFSKIGWLFTGKMPAKPRLKYNEKLFRRVLTDKLSHTFNDKNGRLFRDMLAIVNYQGDKDSSGNFRYGTSKFEYVWEALIDRVYGIKNKEVYFPRSIWYTDNGSRSNARLKPDTIMIHDGDVYVLDAKYYKYGATRAVSDLPESTSINKQITYGEYIATQKKFREIHGDDYKVYNAFLMPFNAMDQDGKSSGNILRIGEAVSEWKMNNQAYERIQGILVDVRHLMKISVWEEKNEIMKLAECINPRGNKK